MSASSAQTFAFEVRKQPTTDEKLDKLAMAIIELAKAVETIEQRIKRSAWN
jgi:hypothetical protein